MNKNGKEFILNLDYSWYKNWYDNYGEKFCQIQRAFQKFEEDIGRSFRQCRTYIYGGSHSGCIAYSFMKDSALFRIVGIMDRFKPLSYLENVPHFDLKSDDAIPDADLVFITAAPRHHKPIRALIHSRLHRIPHIGYMYNPHSTAQGANLNPTDPIEAEYKRLIDHCRNKKQSNGMMVHLGKFADGHWRNYFETVIKRIPLALNERIVVDFGCKYGMLTPLLHVLGAGKIIGIDAYQSYVEDCRKAFGDFYDNVRFELSDHGYIPLNPETADLIILNEVISHINPAYLDTVYSEIHRVLKKGGMVFISDGNNLDCPGYLQNHLIPLYKALELGPDGTTSEGVTIKKSYTTLRKERILERYPGLEKADVDFLALNTSGLYGDQFTKVIDKYVQTGELVLRPYRTGICPVSLGQAAEVEERGFYPKQVELTLKGLGFICAHNYGEKEWRTEFNFQVIGVKPS